MAEIKLCGLLYVNLAAGPITCERPLGHMGGHSAVVPSMPDRTIHWGGAPVPDGAVAEIATWRVGARIPLNVYEGSRAVCQCHTPEDAARLVLAMNRYGMDEFRAYWALPPVPSLISDGAPFVPDGYLCQNCGRIPVGEYNDICEGCLAAGAARRNATATLEALTPASSRCGHNFNIPKCPYKHCAARELYEIVADVFGSLHANGYTSLWMEGKSTDDMDAALKKARGEE